MITEDTEEVENADVEKQGIQTERKEKVGCHRRLLTDVTLISTESNS